MKNFNLFNQKILENKRSHVSDISGVIRVYSAAINEDTTDRIDFNSFSIHDIDNAFQEIYESVQTDNDDEVIYLKPSGTLGQIYALQVKINALESSRKHRVPSSFRFL